MSSPLLRRLTKFYRASRRNCEVALTRLHVKRRPGDATQVSHGTGRDDLKKALIGAAIGTLGTCGALFYLLDRSVKAYEMVAEVPSFPWLFDNYTYAFDHGALRRGWVVYKNVCASCHSLQYLHFGDLVNVTHTAEEVKAIAAEYEVDDGPDAEGNYYKRPGKLLDYVPGPFPNEEAARTANMGAYPPDLTYVVRARKNGINYVFSLLTGYTDPPAGVNLNTGQYFNPYFPNGATGMAEMFTTGMVDYDDGTPAYPSQMAKDVVEFLCWTSSQEHDTRKLMFMKGTGIIFILLVCTFHIHRRYTSFFRSRQIMHIPRRKSD